MLQAYICKRRARETRNKVLLRKWLSWYVSLGMNSCNGREMPWSSSAEASFWSPSSSRTATLRVFSLLVRSGSAADGQHQLQLAGTGADALSFWQQSWCESRRASRAERLCEEPQEWTRIEIRLLVCNQLEQNKTMKNTKSIFETACSVGLYSQPRCWCWSWVEAEHWNIKRMETTADDPSSDQWSSCDVLAPSQDSHTAQGREQSPQLKWKYNYSPGIFTKNHMKDIWSTLSMYVCRMSLRAHQMLTGWWAFGTCHHRSIPHSQSARKQMDTSRNHGKNAVLANVERKRRFFSKPEESVWGDSFQCLSILWFQSGVKITVKKMRKSRQFQPLRCVTPGWSRLNSVAAALDTASHTPR